MGHFGTNRGTFKYIKIKTGYILLIFKRQGAASLNNNLMVRQGNRSNAIYNGKHVDEIGQAINLFLGNARHNKTKKEPTTYI